MHSSVLLRGLRGEKVLILFLSFLVKNGVSFFAASQGVLRAAGPTVHGLFRWFLADFLCALCVLCGKTGFDQFLTLVLCFPRCTSVLLRVLRGEKVLTVQLYGLPWHKSPISCLHKTFISVASGPNGRISHVTPDVGRYPQSLCFPLRPLRLTSFCLRFYGFLRVTPCPPW